MAHIRIDVMGDSSEIVHYDSPDIPLSIRKGRLSCYPDMRAVCHWHDELEIILILSGGMDYYIDGRTLFLHEGEALLVNAREMHYGYSQDGHDCEFICILFHPSLLSSNRPLYEGSLSPFICSPELTHLKLNAAQHRFAIDFIYAIYEKKSSQDPFYELEVIGLLYAFMAAVLRIARDGAVIGPQSSSDETRMLRKMVSYIHGHYKETVCLADIAASASICKSKCCSLFQSQTHMTPFGFLNAYRLEKSAEILKATDRPITAVALDCGFNHSSYYSKLFLKWYHCTPSEYRKAAL